MFRRILAVFGLAVLVTMAAAAPASAHAVLLSTSPAPQSTVPAPPATVSLRFSEAVDVVFGAIRVYDVDGRRVDNTAVVHRGGDKSTAGVGVRRLAAGSYTVSWHMVSNDGHPVRGGFAFYVQHPSAVSSAATTPDQRPSRFVSWLFGAARLLVYASFALLVGLAVVRKWVWTPTRREHDVATGETAFPRRFRRWFLRAFLALVSGMIVSLLGQTSTVAGVSLLNAAKPGVIHAVLGTPYGRWWLVGAASTALLGGVVWALVRGSRPAASLAVGGVLAAVFALASAMSGHASVAGRPAADVVAVGAHLLAVAVWVGGVAALVVACVPSWRELPMPARGLVAAGAIRRFGRVAGVAVVVVLTTGTLASFAGLAEYADLWRTTYGRLITAKVVLLAVALLFAGWHHTTVRRRVAAPPEVERTFGTTSRVEVVVLTAALAVATALVALPTGRSAALAATGTITQEHRVSGYAVQVTLDPARAGDNELHLSYAGSNGLAAGEVANATVGIEGPGQRSDVAMRLLSAGHLSGDVSLSPATYRVVTVGFANGKKIATTFSFTLRGSQSH